MISVFYDGKCGLCSREINHYRKIAPAGVFDWQDITKSADELEKLGIAYADGLRFLHARDEAGRLHIGVDAFILIWQQLPRWRVLAMLVNLPLIRPTANFAYKRFANWRFKNLPHCKIAGG